MQTVFSKFRPAFFDQSCRIRAIAFAIKAVLGRIVVCPRRVLAQLGRSEAHGFGRILDAQVEILFELRKIAAMKNTCLGLHDRLLHSGASELEGTGHEE